MKTVKIARRIKDDYCRIRALEEIAFEFAKAGLFDHAAEVAKEELKSAIKDD
ncbi:MAG: hypothetical protein ACUVTP_04600 [Candidatus Fervidibacter sp.]|uniref:hypothetical protein n=1 Tax=Candidatus Fervidibacter sp. TaxID=3100871 RepID=UPI00404AC6FA